MYASFYKLRFRGKANTLKPHCSLFPVQFISSLLHLLRIRIAEIYSDIVLSLLRDLLHAKEKQNLLHWHHELISLNQEN